MSAATRRTRRPSASHPVEIDPIRPIRSVLRVEVVAICAVAFLADVMSGILGTTFSLHADDLGASVVFIGVLTSLTGLVSLVSSVPIGVVSDRVGRARVLALGMAAFSLAMLLVAVAPGPGWLVPGRLMLGAALVGSFWIAAAYLGDVVTPAERGVAFGLFTTAMGLGFAVGHLIGGVIADGAGIRWAYALAAVVGAAGVVVVLTVLRGRQAPASGTSRRRGSIRESLRVGRERPVVVAGIANILSSIAFGGAVATIFPLYGRDLGLSDAAIGTMFAIRAMASTVVRLPSGALTGIVGSRQVVLGAILIELIAVTGMGTTTSQGVLLGWLILEGIGFGAFLASAQVYLIENTVEATRGAAIGFYSMTGGIGYTLAPLLLGAVAGLLGLRAVFFVSGAAVAVGLVAICWLWSRVPSAPAAVTAVEHRALAREGMQR